MRVTWCEQDDGHGDEGADHQDDQQSNGNPFPVPLRRTDPSQVLQSVDERKGSKLELLTLRWFSLTAVLLTNCVPATTPLNKVCNSCHLVYFYSFLSAKNKSLSFQSSLSFIRQPVLSLLF